MRYLTLYAFSTENWSRPSREVDGLMRILSEFRTRLINLVGGSVFLGQLFTEAGLAPRDEEKADYYRWLFYAAGPVEQAVTNHYAKWDPSPEQSRMFGYGNYDKVVDLLDELLGGRDYVCGDRFTAADVYLGSAIMWGTQFGTLPPRDSFARYVEHLAAREAFQRARKKDDEAQAQMQPPAQAQPA